MTRGVFYTVCMRRIFLMCLLVAVCAGLFAQTVFPSLEPLFVYEAAGEPLSGEDLMRAALDFSLCPAESEKGEQILSRYRELEAAVLSPETAALPPMAKGEKILTLMYEKVLRQYAKNQTRVDLLFMDGSYNCVSSSVLYFALAREAGLQVAGQETPEHAFCSVYIDGKKIDVETTNPGGFNPGVKKIVEQTEKSTRYFVVPKKYYSGRKEVGERKFISLVGRNMVSMMNDRGNYEQGIPLSAARLVFVGNAIEKDTVAVRKDFDTLAGNYAIDLDQKQKKSETALEWLQAVSDRWGITADLQRKFDTIAYNCAVNYLNLKEYDQARRAFDEYKNRLSQKNALSIDQMIYSAWLDGSVEGLSPDETIAFLHEERKGPRAKEKSLINRMNQLEEYAWYQKLKPLFDGEDYLSAAELAEEGLNYVPSSRNLQTIKAQCLKNYAIDIHNAFADLANAGKYQEAQTILLEGLEKVPSDVTLKNDLKRLQNYLKK